MKKMIICVIIFLILLSGIPNEEEFTLQSYYKGEYVSYTTSPISENCINLGICYMNLSTERNGEVIGESMKIENFEPSSAIKELDAKVVKTEYLESGATVIYAYTNKISENVKVDGKIVNLQIAYYEDYSIIGWPLILGSF